MENLIELIPRQTPPNVKILGKRYLVFFEDTNLNFLFCSINLQANKLSPATTFCPGLAKTFLYFEIYIDPTSKSYHS